MAERWYKLNSNFEPTESPFTATQIESLLKSGKLRKSTMMQCEDGRCTSADCVSTLNYIDRVNEGYQYLSHKQRAFLRFLGYKGSLFISQDDCSYAIQRLKTINTNGVDGLNYNELVSEETKQGDKFFEKADAYVRRNGFDQLPKELRPPKPASFLFVLLALPFRFLWLLGKGALKALGLAGKGAVIAGKGAITPAYF